MPLGVGAARVLLVNADPELAASIERIAERELLDVHRVADAGAALASARASRPDAVVIDASRSPPRAFELVRLLRALPGCEALPIAFVSPEATFHHRMAATNAGASLCIVKPVEVEEFGLSMRQLLAADDERRRVLVVDDDRVFAETVAELLRERGMLASTLCKPERILEALHQERPELLLLDFEMPMASGLDVCRVLRSDPAWRDLPTVMLSGHTDAASRVAAFRAGADDYVLKPFHEDELVARVDARLGRSRWLRERFDLDALTGLPLRRPFLEQVGRSMAESCRHRRPLTLALLDLDFFKRINDEHGHHAGDRVLAALGRLLRARFRAEDVRGRWGGEEFVVAFPGETAEVMRPVLARVLEEFGTHVFDGGDLATFRTTFSAGMASCPGDGTSIQRLLEVADRRLYRAKVAGRSRVVSTG
jgi:diguanylate cyclase (GGDEF)-like protein